MRSPPMWRNPKLPDPATLRKLPLAAPPPAEAAITSDRALGESNSSPPAAPAIICGFHPQLRFGRYFHDVAAAGRGVRPADQVRHLNEIKRGRTRAASGPRVASFAKRCVAYLDLQPDRYYIGDRNVI